MRYPRELIEEIRMQNDIVDVISQYVPLKQKGSSYFGLCPFHHEKTPSFSVNSEKQFYYCFGCGASGNVYGFLMEMENCDFPEAVKKLAERANIPLPEPQMTGQALAMERLKARLFEMHRAHVTPAMRSIHKFKTNMSRFDFFNGGGDAFDILWHPEDLCERNDDFSSDKLLFGL